MALQIPYLIHYLCLASFCLLSKQEEQLFLPLGGGWHKYLNTAVEHPFIFYGL